jgi:hypothetical protein
MPAPASASANPSARNSRRTRAVEKPTARSSPSSRARCSTDSRKKSAASRSADQTRNMLK